MSNSLGLHSPWDFPGQNTGVGSLALLLGIFPTGIEPMSRTAGRCFTSWATREAQEYWSAWPIPSSGDLPDQGWNWGLLHWRWILYQLSSQGSTDNFKVDFKVDVCISDINPVSNVCFTNIFSQSLGLSLHSLNNDFHRAEDWILIKSNNNWKTKRKGKKHHQQKKTVSHPP